VAAVASELICGVRSGGRGSTYPELASCWRIGQGCGGGGDGNKVSDTRGSLNGGNTYRGPCRLEATRAGGCTELGGGGRMVMEGRKMVGKESKWQRANNRTQLGNDK
jgi:hypothetical protein